MAPRYPPMTNAQAEFISLILGVMPQGGVRVDGCCDDRRVSRPMERKGWITKITPVNSRASYWRVTPDGLLAYVGYQGQKEEDSRRVA